MNRIKSVLILCISLLFISINYKAQAQTKKLPTLIINEINIDNIDRDDVYIEMVVLKIEEIPNDSRTIPPKIIIDDNNKGQSFQPGYLSIKPEALSHLNPGDIIVLHGSGTDISRAEPSLLLDINSESVEKWEDAPNRNNPSYENGKVVSAPAKFKDFINFDRGNKIQIRVNEYYFNNVEMNGSKNYSLHTDDLNSYSNNLGKSLGGPNSRANDEFIDLLSSQTPLRINCTKTSFNSVQVDIDAGTSSMTTIGGQGAMLYTGPYTLETSRYKETGIGQNSVMAYGLECGLNLLTVTDAGGRTATCEVEIEIMDDIHIDVCKGESISVADILCPNLDSDCIKIKKGNEAYTDYDPDETIKPDVDGYEILIKMSDLCGGLLADIKITVHLIIPGDECDDNNDCTIGDEYDDNCNCVGHNNAENLEIIVDYANDCENDEVILSVDGNFEGYRWKVGGNFIGSEESVETVH